MSLLSRSPNLASLSLRLVWAGVAVVCAAVLVLAVQLRPDIRGMGTHQQLGLAPCGFVFWTRGLPCPTCGMTTAFALMMHGHPWASFITQPLGAILCLATAALLGYAVRVAVTGRQWQVDWERIGPVRLTLGIGLLLVLSWGFKIAHGLMTGILPAR